MGSIAEARAAIIQATTFDSAAEAIAAIHGVPLEAAQAGLTHIGTRIRFEKKPDGHVDIQVNRENVLDRMKKLLGKK